jgi:hypothetical protein
LSRFAFNSADAQITKHFIALKTFLGEDNIEGADDTPESIEISLIHMSLISTSLACGGHSQRSLLGCVKVVIVRQSSYHGAGQAHGERKNRLPHNSLALTRLANDSLQAFDSGVAVPPDC